MKSLTVLLLSLCCYLPQARSAQACNESTQFSYLSNCEYYYSQCTYDTWSGCYIAVTTTAPKCDVTYQEYDTQSRCERFHSQGCEYEWSSSCYVPLKVQVTPPPRPRPTPTPAPVVTPPPAPTCPSSMPVNVCTSGSREEWGTGWGDLWDCDRKLIERYGTGTNLSCYQKANCCWGIH
jgi:hypothetical protein